MNRAIIAKRGTGYLLLVVIDDIKGRLDAVVDELVEVKCFAKFPAYRTYLLIGLRWNADGCVLVSDIKQEFGLFLMRLNLFWQVS